MTDDAARPPRLLPSILPPGPGERRRILVVDDEPGICYMARRVLAPRFEVREAESGEEALRLLESEAFHLAMVDVRLPGMSGLDLLTTVKTLSPNTDVIVMTGSAVDVDEALEAAIRRRAFFFLRKPFPMTILETLATRVAEKQELEEQLERYTRALERNLESARIFQRGLLPPFLWRGDRIRIAATYHPSEQLGGDFFDYWPLPGGGTAVVIADVMGHGPGAAMVTGIVKSQLRSLSTEILDPGGVLEALEEELERIALPAFLSAFLLFDRPDDGELSWASAGHPPALVWTPAGPSPAGSRAGGAADSGADGTGQLELLPADGFLLNTGLPRKPRGTRSFRRRRDTRVLLYTDGYPETRSPAGEAFDEARGEGERADGGLVGRGSPFAEAARAALQLDDPARMVAWIEAAQQAFGGGAAADDDRAAVAVLLD